MGTVSESDISPGLGGNFSQPDFRLRPPYCGGVNHISTLIQLNLNEQPYFRSSNSCKITIGKSHSVHPLETSNRSRFEPIFMDHTTIKKGGRRCSTCICPKQGENTVTHRLGAERSPRQPSAPTPIITQRSQMLPYLSPLAHPLGSINHMASCHVHRSCR
jgi:hypothetical protein